MTRGQVLELAQEAIERIAFHDGSTDPAEDVLAVSLAMQLIAQNLQGRPPVEQRALIMAELVPA